MVGIIGAGYVGLPLAVEFARAGDDVVVVDVSEERVAALAEGRSYVEDVPDSALAAVDGRIAATTDFAALSGAEAVLICVPTPLNANREPDLSPLVSAAEGLAGHLHAGQLVVLESTTYPGTTRERLAPVLEAGSGLVAGRDLHLAFSPERVDPGRTDYTLRTTPKIIGGLTAECGSRATELYRRVCDHVVEVSTPEAAELAKLLENVFRSVNIALVNELAMLSDRMGIDVWEVVDAAATKPFGFMRFDPGPGMGGHCLPVDPFYLSWRAREFDFSTGFIELAGRINQEMPYFCVEKIQRALNDAGLAVRGARILLLGVAYKPGVGDVRSSPALKLIDLLRRLGADVSYHDAHVPALPAYELRNVALESGVAEADLVVIVTAHPEVDHPSVVRAARRVVDLRGITRELDEPRVTRL